MQLSSRSMVRALTRTSRGTSMQVRTRLGVAAVAAGVVRVRPDPARQDEPSSEGPGRPTPQVRAIG